MIEGKVFYEHGEYNISISGLSDNQVEQFVKKLKGIVLLRRKPYNG